MIIALWHWRNVPVETMARKILRHATNRRCKLYVSVAGGILYLRDDIDTAHVDTLEFAADHLSKHGQVQDLIYEIGVIEQHYKALGGKAA